MIEDAEIIHAVLAGDRELFRELVLRYQGAVWGLIRAVSPRQADHDDLAQEAFLAAFTHLKSYDGARGSFRAWLLAIARNACRTATRRSQPMPLPLAEPADEQTPQLLASQAEGFRRLDAALAALPIDQRLVFTLIELQGLSHVEAACVAEVPLGTVKSRLSRAKQWLREALREQPETDTHPMPDSVPATGIHLA